MKSEESVFLLYKSAGDRPTHSVCRLLILLVAIQHPDSAILDVSLGDYFTAVVLEQSHNDKIKLVFVGKKKQSCLSVLHKYL